MKRSSRYAPTTAFAQSIENALTKSHGGAFGGTATNRRIGRVASRNNHHHLGGTSSKVQSRTGSGNQNGAAVAWLNDMPYR